MQRTILANGLINRWGKANSWYETDRLVEFHNGTLKKLLNTKRESALTIDYLLEHCALNTEFFDSLTKQTELLYGINRNSEHPEKSAERDIRVMAQHLSHSGSVTKHTGRTVKHEAVDALAVGAVRIAGNAIANFNKTACSIDNYLEDEGEQDGNDEDEDDIDEVNQFFAHDSDNEE